MSETIFPDGIIVKSPSPQAPDYVVAKLSIKVDEFIAFLKANEQKGWVNLEVLNGKTGKLYAKLDNYTPKEGGAPKAKRDVPARAAASRKPQEEDDLMF